MPILSERDQQNLIKYQTIVANGFGAGTGGPSDVATYRKVMQELDENFLKPPGAKGPNIGSYEPARELRPGLTAAIAIPKGRGPFPVWVHAHGHGLRAAHPPLYEFWMRTLATYGFVIVFPDYRLQPEATYADQVDDMMFGLRWVKENAASIKANTNQMLLGGDSTGGGLAFDILMRQLDDPAGERFRCFVGIDTAMNYPFLEGPLAKLTQQTPLPPIYLEAGSADYQSGPTLLGFAQKLYALRKNFQLDTAYGVGHDFIKMAVSDISVVSNRRMMEFLKRTLA